jgi:hypothetical protein
MSKQKRIKQAHSSPPLQQTPLMDVNSTSSKGVESLRSLLNQIIDAYISAFRQSIEPPRLMFRYFLYNTYLDLGDDLEKIERKDKGIAPTPISWLILSWIPTKLLVRLFVGHHIQSRIRRVILFLQQEEIRAAFSSNAGDQTLVAIGKMLRDLRKFDGLLSKHIKFKLFVSASPFFATVATAIIKVLPKEITSSSPIHLPQQKWELILLSLTAAVYLMFVLVPGFSFKRYIFAKSKIYYLERELFSALNINKRSKEFPLDLFGMLFSTVFLLAVLVHGFYLGTYNDLSFIYKLNGVATVLACIFTIVQMIRAFIGRYKSDNF